MNIWIQAAILVEMTLICGFLFVAMLVGSYLIYRTRKAAMGAASSFVEAVPEMAAAAKAMTVGAEEWKLVPGLIAGHLKVAKALAASMPNIKASIDHLSSLLLPNAKMDPKDTLHYQTDDEVDREAEIRAVKEQHPELERDQIEAVVDSANSFHAQSLGVEE